jgi:ABC-type nitrate/sulfonate/bicarbonate transport system substrate-binding protein
MTKRWCKGVLVALVACLAVGPLSAQNAPPAPAPLRVISFDGGWNLPVWAALRQGAFEANGVAVQISYTPNSGLLVQSLFDGRQDIALALVDNLIAYQEGQGEAKIPDNPDLAVFMSGDGGFLSVVAQPSVKSFADLKGKTLSVDAMTTGAAFVLREIVARNGLGDADVKYERAGGTANRYRDLLAGKHDATLLRTPFELLARDRGCHVVATTDGLGPYMGTVAAARRSWAQHNEAALIGFVRGYRAGLAWVSDPENREIAEAILVVNARDMTPVLARRAYDVLLAPHSGLSRDGALDLARIRTVLALRSKFGAPTKMLDDPARYIDTSYR